MNNDPRAPENNNNPRLPDYRNNNNNNTFGRLPARGSMRVTPTVPPVMGQITTPESMRAYVGDIFFVVPISVSTGREIRSEAFTARLVEVTPILPGFTPTPKFHIQGEARPLAPHLYHFYTALYPIGAFRRGGSRTRRMRRQRRRQQHSRRGKN